jgi:hypothetical protein
LATPMARVLGIHKMEALELMVERGSPGLGGKHDPTFLPETLADGATALQIATLDRFAAGVRGADPFRTAEQLRHAAAEVALPDGRRLGAMSRNLFEAVILQPIQVEDRSGPLVAAATRTIGEAVYLGLLLPPVSVQSVTRTIERRHLRPGATIGGRPGGLQDHAMVSGPIGEPGAGSYAFATHLPTQEREDVPAPLLGYHETSTGVQLDPVTERLIAQLAVWRDLRETMRAALPILSRGERRFAPVEQQVGLLTSDDPWYSAERDAWATSVDDVFPPEAIVIGEVPLSWLEDKTYRTDRHERQITNYQLFVEDVELRRRELKVRTIDRRSMKARDQLEGADEVVVLGGQLIAPDDCRYTLLLAIPKRHAASTAFIIPADRAAAMEAEGWEAVLKALAVQHGPASGPSSDDQGRALSLPFERGSTLTSSNPDKAGNYDVLRFFPHAIKTPSHWRNYGEGG